MCHIHPDGIQHLIAKPAQLGPDEGVRIPLAHEDGRVLVGLGPRGQHLAKGLAEQQPARERDDAGQLRLGGEAREDGHGGALGEAAEDDAVGGDALGDFLVDQRGEVRGGGLDALGVLVVAEGFYAAVEDFLETGGLVT